MPSSRAIVRVFIASPGDLGDERLIAKSAVEEFNNNNADFLGYQVELIGWEDTVSRNGRAQEIINQDLLTCDLFVGMLWKRWGTAPDNTGTYSSGFEEEFTVSTKSYKASRRPQMKMFFKNVDREALQDPGEGLKRVVAFQTKLISDKEIYFETFADGEEFRRRFTRAITNYVQELHRAGESRNPPSRSTELPSGATTAPASSGDGDDDQPEVEFLARITSEIRTGGESISSLDVARLRTLGSALKRGGNDEPYVGVHDANIIFYERRNVTLSYGERRILLDTGLYYWNSHATPLFHWTSGIRPNLSAYLALTAAFGSSSAERVGAIEVSRLLGLPLGPSEVLPDEVLWNAVLGEDTDTEIKVAVLNHLRDIGDRASLDRIVAELDRSNYGTLATAMAAATGLLSRFDPEAAARFLLNRQFETIDDAAAATALQAFPRLEDQELRTGLLHRSRLVRLASFDALRDRGILTPDEAQAALDDTWATIRLRAILELQRSGAKYSPEEARKVLVKPRPGNTLGIGLTRSPERDEDGEAALSLFLENYYRSLKKKELSALALAVDISDRVPFFLYCDRFFSESADGLRKDTDTRFESKFNEYMNDVKVRFGDAGKSLIEQTEKLETYIRKKWTRRALDVLCENGGQEDVRRIRQNLVDEYAVGSLQDIRFLRRLGTFDDIPLVIRTAVSSDARSLWTPDERRFTEAAVAILYLAKGRSNDLLSVDIPDSILKWIARKINRADLSSLSSDSIIKLLMKKDADVRKIFSLRISMLLSSAKCAEILMAYEAQPGLRYYNVISILDMTQSLSVAAYRTAAGRMLAER